VSIIGHRLLDMQETSDGVAKDLLCRFIHDEHATDYFEMCRRRFELIATEAGTRVVPGSTVLEVGPGYGHVSLTLHRLGYKVQASECPETLGTGQCAAVIEAGIGITPWDLHTDACPFEPNSFDLIICSEVLEHLQISLTAAIRKISQALKTDGVIIVTTPNIYRVTNLRRILRDGNITDPFPDEPAVVKGIVVDRRHHQREPTMTEILTAVRANYLEVVKADYFNSVWRPTRSEIAFALLPRRFRDHLLVVAKRLSSPKPGCSPAPLGNDARCAAEVAPLECSRVVRGDCHCVKGR
jgi:2-polyprenyl-3-methyl-5-hydroxy-6-metoxy-1,4-benzoquinol methylase